MTEAENAPSFDKKKKLLIEALEEARRPEGDPATEVCTLLELWRFTGSEIILDDVMRVVQDVTSNRKLPPWLAAEAWWNRAKMFRGRGKINDAEHAYLKAVDCLERADDDRVHSLRLEYVELLLFAGRFGKASDIARRVAEDARRNGHGDLLSEALRLFIRSRLFEVPSPDDLKVFWKAWPFLEGREDTLDLAMDAAIMGARLPQEWNHGKILDFALEQVERDPRFDALLLLGTALTVARRANGERAEKRARRFADLIGDVGGDKERILSSMGFCVSASALSAAGDDEGALKTIEGVFPALEGSPGLEKLVLAVKTAALVGLGRIEDARDTASLLKEKPKIANGVERIMFFEAWAYMDDVLEPGGRA